MVEKSGGIDYSNTVVWSQGKVVVTGNKGYEVKTSEGIQMVEGWKSVEKFGPNDTMLEPTGEIVGRQLSMDLK